MDAKCILNEFYQRYRIAGLNYEFEETTDAGFTCTLALPPIPGGSSSNQDQKCLQEPLSFLGTGSSKKKAAHAAAEAAVAHLQQQGLLAPPPGPSSSPAVGSKRSKANEEDEAEPLQQRVMEALLVSYPAALTAAALTKRCGDWMRKPKVNHLLYNPLSDAGLVEMVDDKQTPAWRATTAAVEAVRGAAAAAGALLLVEEPPATVAAAVAGAGAVQDAAAAPIVGEEGTLQEGAKPATAAAAGATGLSPVHIPERALAGAHTGDAAAGTMMGAGVATEAGPSSWIATLTEGQLAAAVAQVLARLTAEGVLTMHAAASAAGSPASSGKRTRSGAAAAASGGHGGATSSASRPGSAHLREQQQRLSLLAALNQTATSRPTPAGDGGYTAGAGRASSGTAAAAAAAGGSIRPNWKRATSESAGVSWTSAHTTSGTTAAASHGCPPSPAAADAQDTATSSSSRRLPPVAGHRASPQAYHGTAPPVAAGAAVGSGSTGVFSPWQQARSSAGRPASKVPRTATDAMGSGHGLYPWATSQLQQQQAALGFAGSSHTRGVQHPPGGHLLGHQQQQGRAEMTAESLQGALGGSLHLGSPATVTRVRDTPAAAAAAGRQNVGSAECASNWGHPEQLQHQQVLRQPPSRAGAGLGASPGALHAAAMGAGLTSADDLEVLLSGLNHISSLPAAAAAADMMQRLSSGQVPTSAGPSPAAAVAAAQVQLPGASIWTPSGGLLAPSTSAGGARGSSQGGGHSSRGLGATAGGQQEGGSDDEVSPAVLAAAVEAACLEPAPLAADAARVAGSHTAAPSAAAGAAGKVVATAAGVINDRTSSQGLPVTQPLPGAQRQQPVGSNHARPANSISSSQQVSGAQGSLSHSAAAAAAAEAPGPVAAAAARDERSGSQLRGSPRSLTAFDHLTSATLAPLPPPPQPSAAAVEAAAGVGLSHASAAFGHNTSSSHLAGGSLHPMALDLPAVPPAAAAAGVVGGGPAEGVGLKRKLPSTDSVEERAWCSPRMHHHHQLHQQQQQQQQQWQQLQQGADGGFMHGVVCDQAPGAHKPYHHHRQQQQQQQHLQGVGPLFSSGTAGEGGTTPAAAPRRRSQGDPLASGASPPEQQQQQQPEAAIASRRRLKRQARQLDQETVSSGADEEQQAAAEDMPGPAQGQGDPLVAMQRRLSEPLSVSGDAAVTDPADMDSCAVSMTLGPNPTAIAAAAAVAAAAGGLDGHGSVPAAAAAGGGGEEQEGVCEGTSSSLRTAAAAAPAGVGGVAGGVPEDQALELLSRLTLPELPGTVSSAARHHSHATPGVACAPAGDTTSQDHLWQLTAGLGGLGLMHPGTDAHPGVDLASEAAAGRSGLGASDMQGRSQNANKRLKPLPPQLQEEYDRRVQNVRDLVLQLNEALQGLRSIQDQAGAPPGTGGTS